MKRCPTCNRTFSDANLSFCLDDGTPLVSVAPEQPEPAFTTANDKRDTNGDKDWNAVAYQPPSGYQPAGTTTKRKAWPWVVGIIGIVLGGVIGLAIAAALILPGMMERSVNRNNNAANANRSDAANSNTSNSNAGIVTNANANANANVNAANANANANTATNANTANANADASVPPPTDEDAVLAQLTDIENEWTAANINADKQKLERILADDYVSPSVEGQVQGKAEYLRTIQRDTSIRKWEFQDLKLQLRGDRAVLRGKLKLRRDNGDTIYDFVDKFVWRDGRWQATGSEATPEG